MGWYLGCKSGYPQASETNAPPESENGVAAPKPPSTPHEKPPNILGFYVADPHGEKGGVVVIGAGEGIRSLDPNLAKVVVTTAQLFGKGGSKPLDLIS